jgi:hypothetical protein
VGTAGGLYFLPHNSEKFRSFPGIPNECWNLLSVDESILAATSDGVFLVKDHSKQKIIVNEAYLLHRSEKDNNRIWVGTSEGLDSLYRKNGKWTKEFSVENIDQEIKTIAEENKGNLWVGAKTKGVLKIEFPGDIMHPVVTHYGTSHGLPNCEIKVFMAAGHAIFATEDGLYRFDENNKFFTPDLTFGEAFTKDESVVFNIVEDKKTKNIWLHTQSGNYMAIPDVGGTFTIKEIILPNLSRRNINIIYPDGDAVWFGTHEALIHFDNTLKRNYQPDFHSLIRKVTANGKSDIFGGYKKNNAAIPSSFTIIDYHDRNLFFEFAAPFFEAESSTRFRWFMEGYDED